MVDFFQMRDIRDLILGDDSLLYIAYVMLIWAPLIPAILGGAAVDSQLIAMSADCSST